MATILTKKSDTASSVPLAADLTNAAGGAELAVNTADKRLYSKTSGGTVVELGTNPSSMTLPNGTANGIPYLNGSKVLTSGSALTFDGAGILTVSSAVAQMNLAPTTNTNNALYRATNAGGTAFIGLDGSAGALGAAYGLSLYHTGNYPIVFSSNGSEQMRLTSTGLIIGRSSHTGNGGIFEVDANGIGSTIYTAKFTNAGTATSTYNVVTWAQGAAGSAVGYIGTGGSTVGNSAFQNSFVVGTQSASPLVFSTGDSERARIASGGEFLVGQTGTGPVNAYSFAVGVSNTGGNDISHPAGAASGIMYERFNYGGSTIGSITQNGTTAVAYNTTSDHRLKNNVRTADALRFKDIRFVDFEWVDGRHDCGVIAHELQAIYPDLVVGTKDETEVRTVELTPAVPAVLDEEGNVVTPEVPAVTEEQTFDKHQQVNYIGLIPRMGTIVQQLMAEVEAMKAEIAALKAAP